MWLTYPIIRWEHGLEGNTVQWHRWITQSQPAWTARGPSSWMYWKTTNHTKIYSRVKKLSCFHKVQEKQKFQKINPSCSVDWTMHWKVCRVDWMAEQCYLINFLKTLKFHITEWRSFLMWIWATAQYVHASYSGVKLLYVCTMPHAVK